MKKAIKVTFGVVGGIIVIAAIASSAGKSNTQSVPSSNSNASQQSADQKPATEKMTIKNSAYQEADGLKQVVGEITNNDTGKHTATIKATFYDASGKILGTAVGSVNDVAPSETKTFNLYTNDDVTGYKDLKVQVDTLL
jgi:hypothetical protein